MPWDLLSSSNRPVSPNRAAGFSLRGSSIAKAPFPPRGLKPAAQGTNDNMSKLNRSVWVPSRFRHARGSDSSPHSVFGFCGCRRKARLPYVVRGGRAWVIGPRADSRQTHVTPGGTASSSRSGKASLPAGRGYERRNRTIRLHKNPRAAFARNARSDCEVCTGLPAQRD